MSSSQKRRIRSVRGVALTDEEYREFLNSTGVLGISGNSFIRASIKYCLQKVIPDGSMVDVDELAKIMDTIAEGKDEKS